MKYDYICIECERQWLTCHTSCPSCGGTVVKKDE